MAQPTPYKRNYSFKDEEAANPATKTPGDKLDGEFSAIQRTLSEFGTNIKLVQRDDGALANNSVGIDQLKSEVLIGVNPPSTWITAKNYIARDTVFQSQKFWLCKVSHVSGTFSTDEAAGKWEEIADFTAAQDAVLVLYDNGASGLTAENLQDAVDEIAGSINVSSVFGRAGAVVAVSGDYTSAQVSHGGGSVADKFTSVDSAVAGKSAVGHTHAIADTTGLQAALDGKVPTSRNVLTTGLATGGGDLSAARTIDVPKANNAEALAGTIDDKAMTPLRVAEKVADYITTRRATSTQLTLALNSSVGFTHGFGAVPDAVGAYLVCTTTEYSLPVGTRIYVSGGDSPGRGVISVWANTTHVYFDTSTSAFLHSIGGTQVSLTPANWRVVLRAEKD